MIRVLLADDQALVRAGFASLLDAEDDIEVIAQAADGEEALRLTARHSPDVILMDIRMPGIDGIQATHKIAADARLASTHVIILTTFELDEYIFEGLRAGAAGFLVKDTDAPELIRAVRVAAQGDALMSPKITMRLIKAFAVNTRQAPRHPELELLTAREREAVIAIASGLSNDEIAGQLYMSPSTAKTHATRAMSKLGVRDRAQLAVLAYETGLVRPGWIANSSEQSGPDESGQSQRF